MDELTKTDLLNINLDSQQKQDAAESEIKTTSVNTRNTEEIPIERQEKQVDVYLTVTSYDAVVFFELVGGDALARFLKNAANTDYPIIKIKTLDPLGFDSYTLNSDDFKYIEKLSALFIDVMPPDKIDELVQNLQEWGELTNLYFNFIVLQ